MPHPRGVDRLWITKLKPEAQRAEIRAALEKTAGNVQEAAKQLEVSKPYLWWLLRKNEMSRVPEEIKNRARNRFMF